MIRRQIQAGFTLMEIAIVLLIVMIVLGYTVAMFPMQQELKQYRAAGNQMDLIIEELIAFAQVNGRLPCPDTSGDAHTSGTSGTIDGLEDRHGSDACNTNSGFIIYCPTIVSSIHLTNSGSKSKCFRASQYSLKSGQYGRLDDSSPSKSVRHCLMGKVPSAILPSLYSVNTY